MGAVFDTLPFLSGISDFFQGLFSHVSYFFDSLWSSFTFLLSFPSPLKDFWQFIPDTVRVFAISLVVYSILVALFTNFFHR